MTTIAVATDLSGRSAVALRRARLLAAETGSGLILVHVVDEDLPAALVERRMAEAREVLDVETGTADGPPVRIVVEVGDVFSAVPEVAEKAGASLIVAGDHRRRRFRDLFRDTTVERLIRVSSLPVLIARTPAEAGYAHPLVAVESEEAAELLKALELVSPKPSRLVAVHAHGAPAAGLMFYAGIDAGSISYYQRTHADRTRSRLARSFDDTGFPVDIRVVDEVPLEAIARIADAERCDLIVVSSHTRRGPVRGLLGSVSSSLIHDGHKDLMIVPRVV